MRFYKYHGIGNDFLLFDFLSARAAGTRRITPALARALADRHKGIGFDQLLVLKKSRRADAFMGIMNADGSTAAMCGNGIRAAALFLHRRGPAPGRGHYDIDTLAGVKRVRVLRGGGAFSVDMGVPRAVPPRTGRVLKACGRSFNYYQCDVGNDHAVIFVRDPGRVELAVWGPAIETHRLFKRGTNVEFARVAPGRRMIEAVVWERGAGVTLGCGTGICAVVVAAAASGRIRLPARVRVRMPGGTLLISWAGPGKPIIMEGPAVEVFTGELRVNRG
ncbi:MAG: diaminopimelate epimerase [Bdellovibrionales bacterium RIFOXYD1_FULL_53_11]|nr:MAG: diaminopimelate epimerase [Bdellovibrionales bacterium RIFOXYD1_FULL_53_11]